MTDAPTVHAQDLGPAAAPPEPAATRAHITSLTGTDICGWQAYWRDGQLRGLEVQLQNGDVLLVDALALRLLVETNTKLRVASPSGRTGL